MAKVLTAIILVLLGLLSLWYFFLRNEDPKKATREGPIIFFGDSLTAGTGAGESEDFPSLIAKDLNLNNVINAGVPGDTTSSALQRLQQDVLNQKPSIVVVELSGNDFLQQVSVDETVSNLDSIASQIHKEGAGLVLVHIKFPQKSAAYEAGFKKIAKKYKVEVVWNGLDGIIDNPTLMSDTIHPNAAGYKILAERIEKVLKELL